MSLHPANYQEALEGRQAADARRRERVTERGPMLRCGRKRGDLSGTLSLGAYGLRKRAKPMARKPLKPGRPSKKQTADGDSERDIKRECDRLVSEIIALEGKPCFTCHSLPEHVEIHPGHFITRKVLSLRWDMKRNIRPQCNYDNKYHNIEPSWYRFHLALDIGESEVKELERIERDDPRLEYTDLLEIRDGLRAQKATLEG